MEQKVKADQIPARAHRLYVQLYCERKGEKDKKTIQEAKKSWKSLSLSKKQLFYKTTLNSNLLNYAHGLSQTKTYLKEKVPKLHDKNLCKPLLNEEPVRELEQQEAATIDESYLTENGSQVREEKEFIDDKTENYSKLEGNTDTHIVNIESPETQPKTGKPLCELILSNGKNNTNQEEASETQEANIGSPLCDASPPSQVEEIEDALETQSNASTIQRPVIPLAEPTPPTVRIGKDLYEMIKQPGSAEWKDLSKKDKSHLNSAVRTIKREYIKDYTKYLESLSQQQLFDHYIKTLC